MESESRTDRVANAVKKALVSRWGPIVERTFERDLNGPRSTSPPVARDDMVKIVGVAHSRRGLPRPLRRLTGPVLLLGLWWVAASGGLLQSQTLPSPGRVAETGWQVLRTGELSAAVSASLVRVILGLTVGVAVGLALALLSALISVMEDVIDGPVQIVRALPVLALVPLAILWFGIGELSKVLLIAWATAFPVYLNTFAAIKAVDRSFAEMAQSLELRRNTMLRRVVLPGAMPGFLVGLRYSMTLAWLVLVVSEQINANSGLGYLMTEARSLFRVDLMAVCLVTYGCLGWASDFLVRGLERRALSWRRPGFGVR